MVSILAARVWHYWIAVPLMASAVLGLIAFLVVYLWRIESRRSKYSDSDPS